jgi:hypothetical protein
VREMAQGIGGKVRLVDVHDPELMALVQWYLDARHSDGFRKAVPLVAKQ